MASPSTSSPPTTLWATASKEWVIQPKPKPGRKPKKDLISPSKADNEQADSKGRRIQNRAAQRAFRERKQSQLSELQARIQAYEQGEIERNVALQNVAKRLKEENESLRQENWELQARILQMQQPSDLSQVPDHKNPSQATEKKRWRDASPSTSMTMQPSASKKPRKNSGPNSSPPLISSALQFPSPSSTMVSTPESNDMPESHFSPISYDNQTGLDSSAFNRFSDLSAKETEETLPFPSFGCGFCNEGTICVCHEIAVQHVTDPDEFKSDDFSGSRLVASQGNAESQQQTSTETGRLSILDNLPAYQPPVALRRRTKGSQVNSVFPVETAPDPSRTLNANCSGDPSNCLACNDDAFGKAFCAAIEISTSMHTLCDNCPSSVDINSSAPQGEICGGSGCTGCPSASSQGVVTSSSETTEFMPTNDAWRKLKSHPNVEFADLSLLAEVVSRRSKCSGLQLTTSPAPQTHQDSSSVIDHILDAPRRGGLSPPPQLVPQEVLLECGRRRLRHVHADGVKEALRMLDAKFS